MLFIFFSSSSSSSLRRQVSSYEMALLLQFNEGATRTLEELSTATLLPAPTVEFIMQALAKLHIVTAKVLDTASNRRKTTSEESERRG